MIITIAILLHAFLVINFTLRILWRDNLSPVARLAWFVVIIFFPYLGVVIYGMFGEIDLGRFINTDAQEIKIKLQQFAPDVLGNRTIADGIPSTYRAGFNYAQSVNGFYPVADNHIELMPDAEATLKNIIKDIDNASQQIHILYYIWLADNTGKAVANALIRAAQRGVKCRVIVDALGSRAFIKSSAWQAMKAAGVELERALPFDNLVKTLLFSRIDLRNHRKITIIDGKITYCGSRNCADPEFLIKAKYAPWVDIMCRIQGPVVAQNQMLFASDWLMAKPQTALSEFIFATESIKPATKGAVIAAIYADGPTERQVATPQLLSTLFAQAQSELLISTPYFVPDSLILGALCATAYRGVDVTLIVPQRNDSFVVAATSHSYYRQLLEAGIKIFEFRNGLLHAKTLTIDGQVAFFGSTNLDLRSFDLNYENNILVYDEKVTQAIRNRQQTYLDHACPVSLDHVNNWSVFRRLWNNVVATIGPVL